MLLMIAWTSLAHAQNVEEPSGRQENSLNKLMSMLNQMTDEQKAYARANWLVVSEFLTTCGSRLSELFIITIQCKQVFN